MFAMCQSMSTKDIIDTISVILTERGMYMDNKLYKLMDWPAIEEIVYSESSHPKSILGGHRVKEGFLVQVFRPDAVSVSISVSERKRKIQMEKVDDAGFFASLIPLRKDVKYTLDIEDRNGIVNKCHDPYSFDEYDDNKTLFNRFIEGTEDRAYRLFGGHECKKDGIVGTLFRTWAPSALRVSVVGDFNNWDGRVYQMERICENGIYELFIPSLMAGTEYMYEIKFHGSNTVVKSDPYAMSATEHADAHSVVTGEYSGTAGKKVSYATDMKETIGTKAAILVKKTGSKRKINNTADSVKKTLPVEALSILEVRVKDIADIIGKDADYVSIADWIAEYVSKTGYTHIQIMCDDNVFSQKGYSYAASCYYVPTTRYGKADKFRQLIDKLHAAGIGVILEWNGAYYGSDVRGIDNYDGGSCYGYLKPVLDRKKNRNVTTFAYEKGEVRSFLISDLAMWIDEYHIDGIRLTDTATMLYLDYGKNPGEWTPNMYGGNENLDGIDFIKQMNAYIHSKDRYIISIADESSRWPGVTSNGVDSLGFDYKLNDGMAEEFREFIKQDPLFRKGMYNRLTYEMFYHYKERFMTALSYDALADNSMYELAAGNTVESKLSDMRAALGYMYTYPGTKCISFGNDTGILMTDEDNAAMSWERISYTEYEKMLSYINRLNGLYKSEKALYELDDKEDGFTWIDNYNAAETVLAYERISADNDKLLVVVNFTPVMRKDYILHVPSMGKYKLILDSSSSEYGTDAEQKSKDIICSLIDEDNDGRYELNICIPPSAIVIYRYEPYSDVEIKELRIKNEARAAKIEAEKKVELAKKLAIKADEEAKRAAEAEKAAKESLKIARQAQDEAEKKAKEAVNESIRIDEEMKRKLLELRK